ncbi:hypothetical protein ABVT39_003181 [Epinephelus coioides]
MVQLEEKKKEHQDHKEVMPTAPVMPKAPPLPTPPPPPYPQEPTQPIIGQYPLRDAKAMEMEGQLQGKFTVTLTKNAKQEVKKKKQQEPRKKLPLEKAPPSETDSTDGSSDDDGDTEATDFELCTKAHNGMKGRDAEQPTDLEMADLSTGDTPPRESCSSLLFGGSKSPTAVSRRNEEEGPVSQSRPLSAMMEQQLQIWLEQEEEHFRRRQEEARQGTATIDPTTHPGHKMTDEPSDRGGCGLGEGAPRGASPKSTQDLQLLQQLEGVARRSEERVQRMAQELEKINERLEVDEASQHRQREPQVSPTTEHITLTLQGIMGTDRARSEEAQATDKGQKIDRRSQNRAGMTLRNGKTVGGDLLMDLSDEEREGSMCPIITRTGGRKQYEPWPFMDMIGLAERLPVLTDGADKWIMAL